MPIGRFVTLSVCNALVAIVALGCASPDAPVVRPASEAQTPSAPAARDGVVIAGERFTTRVLNDPAQKLVAGVVAVPTGWTFDYGIDWNYADMSNPVTTWSRAVNPANDEAVFGFQAEMYFDLQPRTMAGNLRIGQRYNGYVFRPVGDPLEAMIAFIHRARPDVADLTVVGYKELPGLPAALHLPTDHGQPRGLAVKVAYRLEGRPVDEEFYAVAFRVDVPSDSPVGRMYQINWGLMSPHSFRGPAGTLDQRRPVFASIVKSVRPNPAWQARLAGINHYLEAAFAEQMAAGYDRIAAAGRISQMISANNDAMIAQIDRQLAAQSTGGPGGGRSGSDHFDDYIRGVVTLDDPYYGTAQLDQTQSAHWTDGYGSYRSTNDPTFDPNQTEAGNWTLMRPVR